MNITIFNRMVLVAVMVSITGLAQAQIQWPGSAGGNDHSYEAVLATSGITWDNAYSAAEARGGYLATITSAAENEFVFSLRDGL